MKFELYNSAMIRAPGRLFEASRGWGRVPLKVRWGFLDHPELGPTLVDTGYGPRCYGPAVGTRSFGLRLYTLLFKAELLEQGQVEAVLAAKGLATQDVQTVIVSHLHADHVSELRGFTNARFIGSRRALAAVSAAGWRAPLAHGSFPELLPDDYADRLTDIDELPLETLPHGLGEGRVLVAGALSLVALEGHAVGHFVLLFHADNTLYAVDAHWVLTALASAAPMQGLPKQIADDTDAAEATLARLRAFQAAGGNVVFCHDPNPCAFDVD